MATTTKRKKYVFSRPMVAHLWAHQTQEEARDTRTVFFFDGKSIFSYGRHYCIARLYSCPQGEQWRCEPHTPFDINGRKMVLINSTTYSSATSGHKSCVLSAIPQDWAKIEVPYPQADEYSIEKQGLNMDYLLDEIRQAYDEQMDSKKRLSRRALFNARIDEARKFWAFFGTELLKGDNYKPSKLNKRFFELVTQVDEPTEQGSLIVTEVNTAELTKSAPKPRKTYEPDLTDIDLVAELQKWRDGGYVVGYVLQVLVRNADTDLLRIKDGMVQTSRGMSVELDEAKRAYKEYKTDIAFEITGAHGGSWSGYEKDGKVHIGCHTISPAEIELLFADMQQTTTW
jgi:hypothetical protein